MGEAFDITFRSTRGELSFWFGEPLSHIKKRFGLQQEILIIYSPHNKTDARVMTAIENIVRSPEFKHRVEKVVSILIHNGSIEETKQLIGSSEDRIIIQIHADELLDNNRGSLFVRTKLVESIGAIDLFGMHSPITSDKYFFGRSELVQSLVNRSTVNRENSGLFGLRKTGKTSVLRAIQRRLDSRTILTEYIECSNPGIHSARWWQVLENIAERCVATLQRDFKKLARIRGGYSKANAGTRFSSDMQEIIQIGSLDQIIIMLDEVEFITHGLSGALGEHWDNDFVPFWQSIRSTHQETMGQLIFIVAGVNPTCVEVSHFNGIQNPIFQLTSPHYLLPFTSSQIREMVRTIGRYTGIKFDEDVYQYLQENYGGHPFLIRIACSEVWKSIDRTSPEHLSIAGKNIFKRLNHEIRARLAHPIKDILLSLVWWYPEEYDLLRIIASGDSDFVEQYKQNQLNSIFKFSQFGILKSDNNEFAIADIKEFLNQYGDSYKSEISPFTRGDMPPELLPEVPDLQQVGKLFQKRSEIELKLRKVIMLYLSVKHAYDQKQIAQNLIQSIPQRADRPDVKDLFVGRLPKDVIIQLYCPDLKHIIVRNWDQFKPLFDNQKARFEMNMDTLNIARRVDAHTKPITQSEAQDFENSYGWLLNRLSVVEIDQ